VQRDVLVEVAYCRLGCHAMPLADARGMPKDDELVTISFIASSLRVSRQTAWRWVRDKKIRATAIKVGSRTVFHIRYGEYRRFLDRYVRDEDD
jgi:hypothetical protein